MRLTAKGRYAVMAIMDLALHRKGAPISIAAIAERQGIPQSYLGRLFAQMNRAGLVAGQRGPNGGYLLAREPNKIMLADVLEAIDERVDMMRCDGGKDCHNGVQCLAHTVWEKLGNEIWRLFTRISLAEVIAEESVAAVAERQLLNMTAGRLPAAEGRAAVRMVG